MENQPHGIDIGARVYLAAAELLGRHVGHGADDHVLPGQLVERLGCGVGRRREQLGQPEVQDLEPPVAGHHQVGRLEIAVDDAAFVRRRQGVGQGDGDLEDPRQRQPVSRDELRHRLALDQLHRQEMEPVDVLEGVDGDDAGVAETGQSARLPAEPAQAGVVDGAARRQHLERHPATEIGVLGDKHLTHTAAAEGFHDPVAGQSPTDEGELGTSSHINLQAPGSARNLTP